MAAARVPALTSLFSDAVPLTSLVVAQGGLITFTALAPHGFAIGSQNGVAIVDAWTPNAITELELLDADSIAPDSGEQADDVLITVTYPHALTTTPDASAYIAWDAFARLLTPIVGLNGFTQLVSVRNSLQLVVRPPGLVTLPPSVPAGACLLEQLEREVAGWHTATAVSATVLTAPTPAAVTRSYTVANPKVVKNIRVWGAVNMEHALSHFTRGNESDAVVLDQSYIFVMPYGQARVSRDRLSRTDATTEITPETFVRQMLIDGVEILCVLPAERYGGAVGCIDKCQGPVLTAMLQTFNGLKVPRTEIASGGGDYVMFLADHGVVNYDRANYAHAYRFEVGTMLDSRDCVPAVRVPDIAPIDIAIQNGDPPLTDPILPIGSTPLEGIHFAPAPGFGLWQKDQPQPLTAHILGLQGLQNLQ